jgi:hypothetical protein
MSLNRSFLNVVLSATALLGACGEPQKMAANGPIPDDVRDLRSEAPASDPAFIEFLGPDLVILPGQEKMFCQHLKYEGEDAAFHELDIIQSKFGHHFVLLAAKEPKPPGTLEDCSEAADMKKYDAYTAGGEGMPPGHGMFLPHGKSLVMQSHYVNASPRPILVRDILRLKKRPISDVKTWVSLYVTAHLDFTIPAGKTHSLTYDCPVPVDGKLLFLGGHMHEWGSRFEAQYGDSPTSMQTLYKVDKWTADYRDAPPIKLMMENPMPITKGSTLRVTCEWNNTENKDLSFPHEMCTTFGYLAGPKESVQCRVGEEK